MFPHCKSAIDRIYSNFWGEKEILIRRNDALIADNERFRNRLLQTEKDVADTKGELELIDDLINR